MAASIETVLRITSRELEIALASPSRLASKLFSPSVLERLMLKAGAGGNDLVNPLLGDVGFLVAHPLELGGVLGR